MQWIRLLAFGPSMNTRSFLQDSDPRSKLVFAATYFTLVACSHSLFSMVIHAITGLFLMFAARLPPVYLWNGLKSLLPFLLALFFYRLLSGDLPGAVNATCKLIFFIITLTAFSFTTTPAKLTDGLEAVLRPFQLIRLPVHNFVLMISVAFRFIPLFIDEVDSIIKSQKIKSANFGDFRTKTRFFLQLPAALFVAAFRRADQLALAMDARCYSPETRIRAGRLRFSWRDGVIFLSALVLLLIHILLKGAALE